MFPKAQKARECIKYVVSTR